MPILTRAVPAPGGAGGSGGAGNRIFSEELAGLKNQSNNTYTTAADFVAGSEAVYYNGVRLLEGVGNDYVRSESGGIGTGYDTITLVVAPHSDDNLLIDYNPV